MGTHVAERLMAVQTSEQVREDLLRALRLDLVGPVPSQHQADAVYERERLPMAPTKWYLTGFLAPRGAPDDQRSDDTNQEELDLAGDADSDGDDDQQPEQATGRRQFFPSSIGLSVLVPAECASLDVEVCWGDYGREPVAEEAEGGAAGKGAPKDEIWRREPRNAPVTIAVPDIGRASVSHAVANSGGLKVVITARRVGGDATGLAAGTRAVAVFLVNERAPAPDDAQDGAFAFQAALEVRCSQGFVARPDPRSTSEDWDDRVSELQFANVVEYATGHGVSADATLDTDGICRRAWTTWTPSAQVRHVQADHLAVGMLGMEALAGATPDELKAGLTPLVSQYTNWIAEQRAKAPSDGARAETARDLLRRAELARDRIAVGIAALDDDQVRKAFQTANRAMAAAARRRDTRQRGMDPTRVDPDLRQEARREQDAAP